MCSAFLSVLTSPFFGTRNMLPAFLFLFFQFFFLIIKFQTWNFIRKTGCGHFAFILGLNVSQHQVQGHDPLLENRVLLPTGWEWTAAQTWSSSSISPSEEWVWQADCCGIGTNAWIAAVKRELRWEARLTCSDRRTHIWRELEPEPLILCMRKSLLSYFLRRLSRADPEHAGEIILHSHLAWERLWFPGTENCYWREGWQDYLAEPAATATRSWINGRMLFNLTHMGRIRQQEQ